MQFVSALLATLLASVAYASEHGARHAVPAELKHRRLVWPEHYNHIPTMPPAPKLPPPISIPDPTPAPTLEEEDWEVGDDDFLGAECLSVDGPVKTTQYAVVSIDAALSAMGIDLMAMANDLAIDILYKQASATVCDQIGAVNEIVSAELVAYDAEESSFLLKLVRASNSMANTFYSDDGEDCGPELFSTGVVTDGNYTDGGNYTDISCDCPSPTEEDVIDGFNSLIGTMFGMEASFVIAIEQTCEDLNCTKGEETTYGFDGVCLGTAPATLPEPMPETLPEPVRMLQTAETDQQAEPATINSDEGSYEPESERNPCNAVDANLVDNQANRNLCQTYLDLPLTETGTCHAGSIPKTVYSVSSTDELSLRQIGVAGSNPDYDFQHYSDEAAADFIRENCGEDVASAYECLAPYEYRADLFRFCALHSKGGVYMDTDILPLVPIGQLYDQCSMTSVGHDFSRLGHSGKQTKMLAGQMGAPLHKCMLDRIVENVRSRSYPHNPLAFSGSIALEECYQEHPEGVSITYRDTRNAAYPYSGMSGKDSLLAFEVPSSFEKVETYQHQEFYNREVYCSTCALEERARTTTV